MMLIKLSFTFLGADMNFLMPFLNTYTFEIILKTKQALIYIYNFKQLNILDSRNSRLLRYFSKYLPNLYPIENQNKEKRGL